MLVINCIIGLIQYLGINQYILFSIYKQRGPNAVEAANIFHYLTYEGTVQISSLTDPIERQAIACQINEFGQCPKQLFKIEHPPKYALRSGQMIYKSVEQIKQQNEEEIPINVEGLIWENLDKKDQFTNKVISKAHKTNITDMVVLEKKNLLVTIGQDGFLKVIDLKEFTVLKSFKVDEFCLSVIVVQFNQLIILNILINNQLYQNKMKYLQLEVGDHKYMFLIQIMEAKYKLFKDLIILSVLLFIYKRRKY